MNGHVFLLFEGMAVCSPGEEPMERSEEKWDGVAGIER
jgi:hypothetical protein